MNQKKFFSLVSESFPVGKVFSVKDINEKVKISGTKISYYLGLLVKNGAIRKDGYGKWTIKPEEGLPNPTSPNPSDSSEILIKISPKEKEVLNLIFEVPLKTVRETTRFNLGSLKKKLTSPDQLTLLEGLLAKLQQKEIITVIGAGNNGETIIQINDDLFLKCLSDEHCKVVPLSDNEIDTKIKKMILDSKKLVEEKQGFEEILEEKRIQLGKIEGKIANLSKTAEEMRAEVHRTEVTIEGLSQDSHEAGILKLLETMPVEKRRSFFKKIMED